MFPKTGARLRIPETFVTPEPWRDAGLQPGIGVAVSEEHDAASDAGPQLDVGRDRSRADPPTARAGADHVHLPEPSRDGELLAARRVGRGAARGDAAAVALRSLLAHRAGEA